MQCIQQYNRLTQATKTNQTATYLNLDNQINDLKYDTNYTTD